MPGSLGGLVVSLGINSAEFTSGLTKAEFDAKKFAATIDRGIATAANIAATAIAGIGVAAAGAFVVVKNLVDEAGHFQDIAEKTGASAEGFASLAIAAKVAGTSVDDLATFSIKLSKNLSKTDDETSNVGAALEALGIPIKEFKALAPEEQFSRLAKALSQFNDAGGGKAAALEAIAKGGAQLLPFLKELEEGTGRVNILTKEQIQRADEFSDATKRSSALLGIYAQALATEVVPAMTAVKTALTETIKEMLGLNTAAGGLPTDKVRNFAEDGAKALGFLVDAADGVVRVFQGVGIAIGANVAIGSLLLKGEFAAAKKILFEGARDIDALLNRELFSTKLARELARQRAEEAARAVGPPSPGKAILDFSIPKKGGGGGADRVSEAERFLESLKRQLETTEELTTVEKALRAIQEGRLKGLTPALREQILGVAAEIDQYKELKRWLDEDRKAFDEQRKAAEAAQRERDKAADSAIASAQKQLDANEALRDEIAIILGGYNARKALEKQRVQDAINIKEQFLAERELEGAMGSELDAIRIEIDALKERGELLKGKDFAEQLKKDAEQLQQFKNIFADTFADAFASFIDGSKSAKDAFKDFAKSVEQQITRLAAQNIANAIFGGTSGGGGFDFSKIIASLFGAAAGGFGGAGGGGGFGTLATGTPNWRGGPTWVGEDGPEIVNLPKGASVTPAKESAQMFGPRMNFVINVLPGANTKTANQAAMQTGIAVQRALAKNG
jgi:hypothetical protein